MQKVLKQDVNTSNYELERPLPRGKNKKVIELIKDELGGKIMIEFAALRSETYSYLADGNDEYNRLIIISQQRFRSEKHNVFNEKVNKIALTANDITEYNQ